MSTDSDDGPVVLPSSALTELDEMDTLPANEINIAKSAPVEDGDDEDDVPLLYVDS